MVPEFPTSHAFGRPPSKGRKPLVDKSDSTLPFPFKLHQLLEEADEYGTDHIISWLPSGEAFKIHDPKVFETSVMTMYFKQSKLKSFTRQLYIYGFTKISKGRNMGGFFHPDFRREDQKACMTLSRRENKEDRRVKKNRPQMLEDLQRSLAKGRTSSFALPVKKNGLELGTVPAVRNTTIPQSLLASFPTSIPRGATVENKEERAKKNALTLFDQTFGDDLDMDDFLGGTTSLGPISAMETKALPAPPCALPLDFQKQSLPRSIFQGFPDLQKSTSVLSYGVPQQQQEVTTPASDVFHMEPRSIEEMLDAFVEEDDMIPFAANSFFGAEHFTENHNFMMMET